MRVPILVLAILSLAILFTGLDRTGFVDAREARDVQVAREIAGHREIITPLLGSTALFEKPLLAYAAEAAIRKLSHHGERDSRAFRAVVAFLLVLVTGSIGARHFGARAGWFAAGVLLTCLALPHAARTDGTQLLATLLGWLGCAGLADTVLKPRPGLALRLVFAYTALGFTLVTAGPLPALWPFAGLVLYLVLKRQREPWRRVQPWFGLALMIGLALPWYGAMIDLHGTAFLARVPFFPYASEPRGPLLAGPVVVLSFLVIGLFPWSALVPGAILHAATWWRRGGPAPALERAQESAEENSAHFFVAAFVAALAPLLFYPTPPLTASLPAAPAAALLCARFLDHAYEDVERVATSIARAVGMLALVGTMTAILIAFAATPLRGATAELRLLATALFITSWAPFLANFAGRRLLAALLLGLPVALGTPIATLRVLPAMEDYLSTRSVAVAMETAAPSYASLVLLEPPPATLRLYGEHNLVQADSLSRTLEEQRAVDGLTYVAFRPARERDVMRGAEGPLEILLRTPAMVLARVHR